MEVEMLSYMVVAPLFMNINTYLFKQKSPNPESTINTAAVPIQILPKMSFHKQSTTE